MTKKGQKMNVVRTGVGLGEKDHTILKEAADDGITNADFVRKAIRILDGLRREEFFLHTPNGDKIPKSIIFS